VRQAEFDLVVLGAGSAGLTAALVARGLGATVALVERGRLGGECTWRGCVPSKSLLAAARAAAVPDRLGRFGLTLEAPARIDTSGVMAHVRSVSEQVGQHESAQVLAGYGIEVVTGDATFTGEEEVEVGGRTLTGRRFVIATGSRPLLPPVPGLDETTALTSDTLWDIDALPRSLAIVGGGPVAVEMASAFVRLGTRVTLLVRSKLLRAEEPELVERLRGVLESQGVEIVTGASLEAVETRGEGVGVTVTTGGRALVVDRLLVATGRGPVVPDGLDVAGVEVDARGIVTDAHMRTTAHHIFAAGDVTGPYRFTHVAEREGIAAATNALLPVGTKVGWDDIVWVLFAEPELAHLGLTEEQARAIHGDGVEVRRYDFATQDRARAEVATEGMAKYVLDHRGHLLGAHILGERAGELIGEAAVLLHNDMPLSSLSSQLHAYPTFADALKRPADAEYTQRLRDNPAVRGALRVLVGHNDFQAEP
jgi:pyruvate/2-oxoglutarate dehydrogenase complex dihydrolipoamide dehydrogenase (E3) component